MIDVKRAEVKNRIYEEFESALKQAETHIEAYGKIKGRLEYWKEL